MWYDLGEEVRECPPKLDGVGRGGRTAVHGIFKTTIKHRQGFPRGWEKQRREKGTEQKYRNSKFGWQGLPQANVESWRAEAWDP